MKKIMAALEIIDFQRDDTGSQIEAIFSKMIEKITADPKHIVENSEEDVKLTAFIEKRFGLKTYFSYGTDPKDYSPNDPTAACMPMRLTPYHVFDTEYWRGKKMNDGEFQQTMNFVEMKGTIDLQKAKVSGIFSDTHLRVWMNLNYLHRFVKLTVPEITSVLLHELGHLFTFFEFSSRLSRNNQILQHLADVLKTDNKKQLEYVFKEITHANDIDEKTFDDILKEDNRVIMGFRLFQRYIDIMTSNLPNAKYSDTSAEQLADNFAARFGYGRQIIIALDKLTKYNPEKFGGMYIVSIMIQIGMLFGMLEKLSKAIAVFISLGSLSFFKMIDAIFFVLDVFKRSYIFFRYVYQSGDDTANMTYDLLKIRYKRIRHQYIELLKNTKLPKDEIRMLLEDIKIMDKSIDETMLCRSIYATFSNFVFSRHRNTKKDIEFQQLLEELAHNDLFLKSAELSTL